MKSRFGVVFWCGVAAAVVCGGLATFVDQETNRQMQAAGPTAQPSILAMLLQLLPKLGSWGGIIAAILSALGNRGIGFPNILNPSQDDPITPTPGNAAIENEIELMLAVIAWVKKRDDPQRVQRVVLAIVQELRLRFALYPAVLTAAGALADATTKAFYVDEPPNKPN